VVVPRVSKLCYATRYKNEVNQFIIYFSSKSPSKPEIPSPTNPKVETLLCAEVPVILEILKNLDTEIVIRRELD